MDDWYRWEGDDLILDVRVQPKASREKLGEITAGRLKIHLTSPPVDGKANKALIRLLAKTFRVPASSIDIVAGLTSRNKRVRIPSPRQVPTVLPPKDAARHG